MIKKAFPVVAFSVFAGMLGLGIISPLMPVYTRNLGVTGIWIGILLASYSASRAVFMPFIARFSDKRGRRVILATGLLFYGLMSLFYMNVHETWQLLLVRIVHGSAGGMIIPIAKAYIGELSPRGEEGTWMGYYNTAFFAGMGVGPFLGGILYDAFSGSPPLFGTLDSGFVAAFGAMGLLNLLAALTVFLFLPELKIEPGKSRPKASYRAMGRSRPFLGLISLQLVEGLGRTCFFAFIPIFAGLQLGLSSTQIGTVIMTQVLLSAILQAPMGKLTDKLSGRVSRSSMIIGGGIIMAVYMSLAPMAANYWHLLGIAVVAGIVSSITTPTSSAISVSEGRKFGMASVMATLSIALSGGMALGPFLGGIVVEMTNRGFPEGATQDVTGVFYFAAIFVIIGFALFAWFNRPQSTKKNKSFQEDQPNLPPTSEELKIRLPVKK